MGLQYDDLDSDGVNNLMVAIVEAARKDYIKGYGEIMDRFGRVLTEEEFNDWFALRHRKVNSFVRCCRDFYSAIRFVKLDPYYLFNERKEKVLKMWEELAAEKYHESMKPATK